MARGMHGGSKRGATSSSRYLQSSQRENAAGVGGCRKLQLMVMALCVLGLMLLALSGQVVSVSRAARPRVKPPESPMLAERVFVPQGAAALSEVPPTPVPTTLAPANEPELWRSGGWFVSGLQYLTWQPSGGISNQLRMLEWAIAAATVLNRTLLLPPGGPHTTRFWKYNEVPGTETVPMDEIIDVESIRTRVGAAVLRGLSFLDFVDSNYEPGRPLKEVRAEMLKFIYAKPTPALPPEIVRHERHGLVWVVVTRDLLRVKRPDPWDAARLVDLFGGERGGDVLYFSRATMWQNFAFTEDEMRLASSVVRPTAAINSLARILASSLGGGHGGRFNCLHLRFPDEKGSSRADWLRGADSFLSRMKAAGFLEATPDLYIATHPSKRKSNFFKKFKARFNTTFSDGLPQERINKFLGQFPAAMQGTLLGSVEQSLCVRAHLFLGTGFSTFTETIRRMRHYRRETAGDPYISRASPLEIEAEKRFLERDTPCPKGQEMKVC